MSRRSAARADVRVVGAGPAGCATAIALARRGLRVTMEVRGGAATGVGGESLPPAIAPLLAELGVLEACVRGPHLRSVGNESVWGDATPHLRSFITEGHGDGWLIDRAAFDATLLDAAAREGARVSGGADQAAEGGFVVDATGRAAAPARARGAARVHVDHAIAILGILPAGTLAQTSLVEAAEDGYWYSAPLPGGRLFCAFVTDPPLGATSASERDRAWYERLANTGATAGRAAGRGAPLSLRVVAAGTARLNIVHGADWLAVGDAAASRDPLSSGGIFEAIRSGLRAADAIARHGRGEASALPGYAADVAARFARDLGRRSLIYGLERRWPASPFWAARHVPAASGDDAAPGSFRTKPRSTPPWRRETSI